MAENINMTEEIKKLIQLQKLDVELFDNRTRKESFPGKIKQLDGLLEQKKTGMKTAEDIFKNLQLKKNEKELDLKSKETQMSKYQSDLYQVKSNKEYGAIQEQIGSVKADVSLLEEAVINLLDEIDKAQTKFDEEKKWYEDEKKNVDKEKELITQEMKKLDETIGQLEAKKTEFIKTIDPAVLAQYGKILHNRGRIALTKINVEFCGECNMQLRPQIINEAKLKHALVLCENCSRILYVEDSTT